MGGTDPDVVTMVHAAMDEWLTGASGLPDIIARENQFVEVPTFDPSDPDAGTSTYLRTVLSEPSPLRRSLGGSPMTSYRTTYIVYCTGTKGVGAGPVRRLADLVARRFGPAATNRAVSKGDTNIRIELVYPGGGQEGPDFYQIPVYVRIRFSTIML